MNETVESAPSAGMTRLLGYDEAALRLQCSPNTLRYWVGHGAGPRSFKVGRRRLFREEDVEAWLLARYEARDEPERA